MVSTISSLLSAQWRSWLVEKALPFWIEKGFNVETSFFYERLAFDGSGISEIPLRLMVQARQIVTFGRAYLDGFYDARPQIISCLKRVESLYYHQNTQKGWAFSLSLETGIFNPVRDLYAHAFILLAYGWVYKITKEPHYKEIAKQTAQDIALIFKTETEAYLTENPSKSLYRSQNPHMHLLEAYLLLFEVTSDAFYLEEATKIVKLAVQYFIDPKTGFLFEFLDDSLKFLKGEEKHYSEPGHQFEWAWLLQEYLRLANVNEEKKQALITVVRRLLENALSDGLDQEKALVWDALDSEGKVISHNVRIWPQTEFLRVLMTSKKAILAGILSEEVLYKMVERATSQMFETFLKTEQVGGWIDRFDSEGKALSADIPASSLYHIYSAAREFL